MAIPSGLLGKGLFGLCLVGSGAGGFVFGGDIVDWATGVTELLRELKIPEGCKARGKVCKVKKTELQTILFKNKENNQNLTITGLDTDDSTIDLKIEKGQDPSIFTDNLHLKFTIISDKDLEIQKSSSDASDKITVKKNTNTEFKVNNEKKLEKAWSADSLAKKVGLKECKSDNEKKCTIKATGLKFSDDNGTTIKDLTLSNEDADKITYTEDQAEYNQGFKFNVSTEVSGTGTNNVSLANGDYEVKFKEGNDGGWYLSKKTNSTT